MSSTCANAIANQPQQANIVMYFGRPILARSTYGLFHVLDFNPREGEDGMVLTVESFFDIDANRPLRIRLVIGSLASATKIRSLEREGEHGPHLLCVECTIPALSKHRYQSSLIPVTIQAIDTQDRVVDTVTFGNFTYWQTSEFFFLCIILRIKS